MVDSTTTVNALFPIEMHFHIFLALLALLVFGMQFIRYRKWHYALLAVAFPSTLLPYLSQDNMTLFYGVGVFAFAAFILSAIFSVTIDKDKKPAELPKQTMPEEQKQEHQDIS